MRTAEHSIDKSAWPRGPWNHEPDRVEWRDEATGLPCLIVRVPDSGHLCGYVAVPPGHPAHGVDYDDVNPADGYSPHGGLTYANKCGGHVCHVAQPGEPDDVWWLGFDCAHADDLRPGRPIGWWSSSEAYRDVDFVRAECTALAAALKGMTP